MAVSRCPHCQQLLLPDEVLAPACVSCGGALAAPTPPSDIPVTAAPLPHPRAPWGLWAAVVFLVLSNAATLAWILWRDGTARPDAGRPTALVDSTRPPEPAAPAHPEKAVNNSSKVEVVDPPARPLAPIAPPTTPAPSPPADAAKNPPAPMPPPAVAPAPPPNAPAPPPVVVAAPNFPAAIPPPLDMVDLANLDELRGRIDWNAAGKVVGLHLGNSDLSDNELCLLQPFDNLRELDLDHTLVTDKGLVCLQGLKALRSLSVRGAAVTDEGVAALQKALPDVKIVR